MRQPPDPERQRVVTARPDSAWRRVLAALRREPVLTILACALLILQLSWPQPWARLPALVDWRTVGTLAGLLMLTKALDLSGFLLWSAHRLLRLIHTERGLALLLVALAAVLSTLLTNDVALFVVVPLALSLQRLTPLPSDRLIVFIALAVNAGSVLTPFGSPQNLFLWQRSGVSFGTFVVTLAPLCAALMIALLAFTALSFRGRHLTLNDPREGHLAALSAPQPGLATVADLPGAARGVERRLFGVAALTFVLFVVLADLHHVGVALGGVVVIFGLWRREAVLRIDWLLLLIFVLMFMVLRSVAALPAVHGWLGGIDLSHATHAYAAGAILSQGISNVPAAILLAEFTHDWRALAFGVSVGGFGLGIGSLANLIAMRLANSPGIGFLFHKIALPCFLVAVLLGWCLL